MKRTAYLCGIAFLISLVASLSFASPVKAYVTCDEQWSEPNGYAYAKVCGSWTRIGRPYYRVHHTARIFECLSGRTQFTGWDLYNNIIYNIVELLGAQHGEPQEKQYDSPYNVVWTAETQTWAPYYFPPSPNQEYADAFLLPPGMV